MKAINAEKAAKIKKLPAADKKGYKLLEKNVDAAKKERQMLQDDIARLSDAQSPANINKRLRLEMQAQKLSDQIMDFTEQMNMLTK